MATAKVTRAEFRAWLKERYTKTIGTQEDTASCAIAQFILHKFPQAQEADVSGGNAWGFWDDKKQTMVRLPQRKRVDRVINKFDSLPGTPCGKDLLKAMGWEKKDVVPSR